MTAALRSGLPKRKYQNVCRILLAFREDDKRNKILGDDKIWSKKDVIFLRDKEKKLIAIAVRHSELNRRALDSVYK